MVEVLDSTDATATPNPNGKRALPEYVVIQGTPRFSANQLRHLRAATGLAMENVMNDEANVIQAFVWFELQKQGFEGVTWDEAADVPVEFGDDSPDPSSPDSVTTSRPSVGSGE